VSSLNPRYSLEGKVPVLAEPIHLFVRADTSRAAKFVESPEVQKWVAAERAYQTSLKTSERDAAGGVITKEMYRRVLVPSHVSDVVKILGDRHDVETSTTEPGQFGSTYETWKWENPDGSWVKIVFKNGYANAKRESGLK
jgi:hypothetical protein